MTPKRFWLAMLAAAWLTGAVVDGHHSFAAEFDVNKPVTLRGKLTRVELVNPHGWIHVAVANPDGSVTNWAVETGAVTQLLRQGIRAADFPVGTEIIIKGYMARNGKPIANGDSVTFADGRNFFLSGGGRNTR